MKLTILSGKSNPRRDEIEVAAEATVADLKKVYRKSMSVHRKAFKFTPAGAATATSLGDDKKALKDYGVAEGAELAFKDLGPQVGYRTVFVVEYAGPIAFMALYAARPSFLYGAVSNEFHPVQKLYIALFILHFLKREFETFFVHKFSRPTMPLMNIFKNSMYYWAFAAFIGYFLCHPQYTAPTHGLETVFAGLMCLAELGNFAVHKRLSGMRKKEGETTREAPKGGLFALVSCPNYTFEILSWVFFSAGTNIAMSWGFTLVGFLQMSDWALKKHRGYVKNEPALKKQRKAIIPFLL